MSRLEQVVKEFWEIVDSVEQSDGGKYFFPTRMEFSSCRTMSGIKMGKLIEEMKTITGVKPRMTEKEMHLLNHPDDCGECLGTGFKSHMTHCLTCGGTGSTDPTAEIICLWCKGTGDTQNHERESHDCTMCNRTGRVKKCTNCDGEGGRISGIKESILTTIYCKICDGTGFVPSED